MKKLVKRLRFDTAHCLFRGDHAFIHQIAGNLQGCRRRSLSVSGLQEVKFSFLDGEFHILHIPVMLLQFCGNFNKLLIAVGKILFQTGDRLRGPDSGHHILALGVDQIFSVDALRTCGGISCKGNSGSGSISHVSEYHGLHVYSGSPLAGNIVHSAVNDGALIVPGTEYGLHGLHELHPGILREVLSHLVLINCLEALNHFFQVIRRQIRIEACAFGILDLIKHPFKKRLGNFHYHI